MDLHGLEGGSDDNSTKSAMLKSLGGILANANQGHREKGQHSNSVFDFLQLVANWHTIVGDNLAQKTIPLKIQQKSLIILTDHPVYSQQLSFLEGPLKDKIFANFPAVKGKFLRIFFQTNPAHFLRQKQAQSMGGANRHNTSAPKGRGLHPYSPQYQQLKKEGELVLQEITDDSVKQYLLSLYIQLHYRQPHENGP